MVLNQLMRDKYHFISKSTNCFSYFHAFIILRSCNKWHEKEYLTT